MRKFAIGLVAFGGMLVANTASADITVGVSTATSGPGATIGKAYSAGVNAAVKYLSTVSGEKIKVIILDDASDQSTAARNARKLIEQDNVDILIGTSGVPSTLAMAAVAAEKKVPFIALSPIIPQASANGQWVIVLPQSNPLMLSAIVANMKSQGIKKVGFIGYSDALGDDLYRSLNMYAEKAGIQIVADERFARADTSVSAQVIKLLASQPDAIMIGGSGTAGALPYIALRQRGYTKPIYGSHALINPDFVRVGGASVEGTILPTGPVVVAEQLPDGSPTKSMSLAFRDAYQAANNEKVSDSFSPYSFDAWLIMADAAKRVLAKGIKPGTEQFRIALRDEIFQIKDLVGTHGVYTFKPGSYDGLDERGRVLIKLEGGNWKYIP